MAEIEIEIEAVDERDSSWEVGPPGPGVGPRFRVYLHSSVAETTHGTTWTCDVTGAEALQVIDWAQRQAGDRLTCAVALVYDDAERERLNPGHGRGLVWLVWAWTATRPRSTPVRRPHCSACSAGGHSESASPPETMPPGVPDPFNDGTWQRPR